MIKTIEVEVEATVEIDIEEVVERMTPQDLLEALQRRDDGEHDPLHRIWREVMWHGRSLDDAVDELMRERSWRWPWAGEYVA